MSKRAWAAVTAFTGLALAGALSASVALAADPPPAKEKEKAAREAPGKDVFGLSRVWQFRLELSAKEYAAIQPAGGMRGPGFGPGPGGPPRPPEKAPEKPGEPAREVHRGSGFGIDFPWAHGAFT